ncbi:anti sigma factor protein [Nitratireductor aquibiodomus RA22]|uniref:Anti-ECFsigma factor, ChrR n=2 Tax=Nitratireductor aquibiodomus TaxID=204799 RepID=A0A1H4IP49_9HYPH|nr:ChrR family anti-sigma-E factor [Nitratireductor aquibiodomus]EIM78216.1 anti sigma factor protein [Nitratireductor aquibiodomus RA22]SEB35436.1 anti-ECFsigma factor, ChrR [Nitratireductor aquibiodomus]
MTIRHHVSDELLLDYATGALSEGWRIAVATHLALCPQGRRRLSLMEMAGGVLVREHPPEPLRSNDDEAWISIKKRLGVSEMQPAVLQADDLAVRGGAVVLPEPLRSYVGGDLESVKWRPLGRGAYHMPIELEDESTKVRLLRIPAGKPVPEHGHRGRELTLVLSGSFHDGEALFARGDLEEADETLQHQPVATEGEDCICLAVTDAPLKFRSWLLRAIQPILGI